jgi:hypothetical protein
MTPEDTTRIAVIQARVEAATAGPWSTQHFQPYPLVVRVYGKADPPSVAILYRAEDSMSAPYSTTITQADNDAAFIAHARQDIPYLLAALARLQAERDKLDVERIEAVYIAKALAHAYATDNRPVQWMVKTAMAYPVKTSKRVPSAIIELRAEDAAWQREKRDRIKKWGGLKPRPEHLTERGLVLPEFK